MDILFDKIAILLLPENFSKILPYCLWYWIMFTLIVYWIIKKNDVGFRLFNKYYDLYFRCNCYSVIELE